MPGCVQSATPVAIRYRKPSVPAEGPWCYLDARRRLPPFVFAQVDERNNLFDAIAVETKIKYLFVTPIVFDVCLENRVKDFIRRETVGVFLVKPQFGCRRLRQNSFRNDGLG